MKEMMLGKTKIRYSFSTAPIEERKKNLIKLYDVCNQIFKDNPECFYTHEEVKKLKKDPSNIFL